MLESSFLKNDGAKAGLAYSLQVVFYLLFVLIYSLIVAVAQLGTTSPIYYYLNFLVSPCAIVCCLALLMKWQKVPFKKIAPYRCHYKFFIAAFLIAFGMLFSLGWINEVVMRFLKLLGYSGSQTLNGLQDILATISPAGVVVMVLIVALLPAVLEECLFRGAILNLVREDFGTVLSVILVGFLFALFHGSPEQTVYQFIVGCIFALLAIRSGSVIPTMIVHFINNAFIIIGTACNWIAEDGSSLAISHTANVIVIVLSACSLLFGLLILILDKTSWQKGKRGNKKYFFMTASLGIAVMGIIWIASFIVE